MPNYKTKQIHTSPTGDVLIHNLPISAALFVAQRDLGAFCISAHDAPHYSLLKQIELETLRLVHELGFEFRAVTVPLLAKHPGLSGRPLLQFELPEGITLLLVPTGLMPDEMIAVLQDHPDLGVVVSHTLALPRSYATKIATRIMARSYPRKSVKA